MGSVYEASHLRLTRRFAIKVLMPQLADRGEALNRFRREAEIIGAIGHPHIVEVIDYNHTPGGAPYMVMELLEGETLAARIAREGQLSLGDTARIFMQAASALESAHDKGVVHRDLKPQNIFLARVGRRSDFVKVVDFGISKVLSAATGLTRTNAVMGTPWYMAPEQVHEASEVDHRADVWAMGTILYEMLAGRLAFPGTTAMAVLYKVVHEPPAPLRTLRPDLPAPVEECVMRALGKTREERFPSMLAFWEVFSAAVRAAGAAVPETDEDRRTLWPQPAVEEEQPTQTTARAPIPLDATMPPDEIVGQPITGRSWDLSSSPTSTRRPARAESSGAPASSRSRRVQVTGPLRRDLGQRAVTDPPSGPARDLGEEDLYHDLDITGPPQAPAHDPDLDVTGPQRRRAPADADRHAATMPEKRRSLLATEPLETLPAKKETLLSGELQPRPHGRTARYAVLGVLAVLGIGGGFWAAATLLGRSETTGPAAHLKPGVRDGGRLSTPLREDARLLGVATSRPDVRSPGATRALDAGARVSVIERADSRVRIAKAKVKGQRKDPKRDPKKIQRTPVAAGKGSLGIQATTKVQIRLDGRVLDGLTPLYVKEVAAGPHVVEAWRNGKRVARKTIRVKANEENSLTFRVKE
jgi:serine/threonine-protein kinase